MRLNWKNLTSNGGMAVAAHKVIMRPAGEVKPYPKNAKMHPDKQVRQIAASIKEFGFNQPIVVDTAGVIIVGHGRYRAATEILKMAEVPVIELELTPEQVKAYRIADNKLAESEFDFELLLPELKELSPAMLELTGFTNELILPGGTEFELPTGGKGKFEQMTFTLTAEQKEIVEDAINQARQNETAIEYEKEVSGNTNKNGNALTILAKNYYES